MRVGLVCPYSLTLPGGVQGQVLALARALRAKGDAVRVLGPCDGPPPEPGVTPLGRSVPLAANGSVAPIAPDVPAALRTIRALRDEDFDVINVHEPLVPGPCLVTTLVSGAPLVATFHAAGQSASYRWLKPVLRRITGRLDLRCAVSDDAAELAARHLGGSYERVFNGVEVERFAKADPWPSDGPTVLFVGRHEERKGLAVLMEALPHLPDEMTLWVAGDGPDTEMLKARAGDDPRVVWLGRIDDHEKARRLKGADVFCAPSLRGESFGIVLLEAMAASTPIVASDLPGYRNVARHDREALLVRPGDPAALGAAIARAIRDPALSAGLVEEGERRAEELSMGRLADLYSELYRRAAVRRR